MSLAANFIDKVCARSTVFPRHPRHGHPRRVGPRRCHQDRRDLRDQAAGRAHDDDPDLCGVSTSLAPSGPFVHLSRTPSQAAIHLRPMRAG